MYEKHEYEMPINKRKFFLNIFKNKLQPINNLSKQSK